MNNESKKKESILRNNAVQTIIASLLCIVIGLLIGYLVLLIINPAGAAGAITENPAADLCFNGADGCLDPQANYDEIYGNHTGKGFRTSDVFPVRSVCLQGWTF